jgi:soluble lytic murein transglycosylase-like protein
MARIPTQIAERRLDTGNVIQYPSGSPLGGAIESFGDELSQAAATLRAKDERKDAFTGDIVENEFLQNMRGMEDEAERNAPADGSGLHDGVYGQMRPEGGVVQPGSFDKLFDGYLERMPASQREQFSAKREAYRMQGSNRLAESQYKREQAWYEVEIQKAEDGLINSIGLTAPDDQTFEQFRKEGVDRIRKSGLPELKKQVAEANWLAKADEALFLSRMERDPDFASGARAALGLAPKQAATGGGNLVAAVKVVESEGNPRAVSSKGAAGIMQVMPGTAREIAAEIRDPNFKMAWSDESITEYLKDPANGERYGTHYLNKMQERYGGDTEAALIAYNGGPERADKWLTSGRDDSVLPKETADYYKKVLARAGGSNVTKPPADVSFDVDGTRGANVRFTGKDGYKGELGNRVASAFGSLGIGNVRVTSGYRSPSHNASVGGAKNSQHVHRNAMDIDVTGYSKEQRTRIIRALSAAGVGGLGIGNNIIHADIGGRRAWGYKTSAGGGEVPDWAKEAIDEHLAGKAVASGGIGGDPVYANIPFDRRQILANTADAQVNQNQTRDVAQAKADYTARKDAIELDIVNGNITDEAVINQDGILNDGDKATLIRSVREQNKTVNQVKSDLSALSIGGLSLDPYAADDKKRADNLYEKAAGVVSDEQRAALGTAIVEQTGIVPAPIINDLRRGLTSQNIADVERAAQAAQRLSTINPAALARREGGSEVQQAADDFSYYVNDLNLSPPDAAARLKDSRDPAKQRDRKALEPAAKEFRKEIEKADIGALFDESFMGWRSNPQVGFNAQQAAGIQADYIAIAEDQFYRANGDADIAKNRAAEQMKRLYGVTEFTGTKTLMKHPPESYWPKSAIGTDKDWTISDPRGNDMRTIKGSLGTPSLQYAQDQLSADIQSVVPDADLGSVQFVTTPETDAMVKRGEMPAYGILVRDKSGAYQTIPGKLWRPDFAGAQRANAADAETRIQDAQDEQAAERESIEQMRAVPAFGRD